MCIRDRVGATNRTRIARLLENGELDLSFDAEPGPDYTIYTLALQSDGKILVGGAFTMFQGGFSGGNRAKIVRLDPNGRYDPTFSTSAPWYFSEVHALKVLSDDTILM